jgi:hypothetical protein
MRLYRPGEGDFAHYYKETLHAHGQTWITALTQRKAGMKTMRALRLIAIAIAVVGLTAFECSENVEEELLSGEDDVLIHLIKHNLDTENIHIFSRFEDFPCCQVAPGARDSSSTINAREGEMVDFSAGRLGTKFAFVTCRVSAATVTDREATVEFRFDQTLRCRGW